jgi:hypothetical protein
MDRDEMKSRKTHAINREIVRLTAIKNHQNVEEAQREFTRTMQREHRARKLREDREMKERIRQRNLKIKKSNQ